MNGGHECGQGDREQKPSRTVLAGAHEGPAEPRGRRGTVTHYKVNAEICYSIFTKAESSVSSAQSTHSSIRSGVDQLGALCAKGEAAQITSALQRAYNRVRPRT